MAQTRPAITCRGYRWFVPSEGIRRDVLEADLNCYLGHDAEMKFGYNEDRRPGYWISASRNLTSAMIADLKTDSADYERSRAHEHYEANTIHRPRQYYGPAFPKPCIRSGPSGYRQARTTGNKRVTFAGYPPPSNYRYSTSRDRYSIPNSTYPKSSSHSYSQYSRTSQHDRIILTDDSVQVTKGSSVSDSGQSRSTNSSYVDVTSGPQGHYLASDHRWYPNYTRIRA